MNRLVPAAALVALALAAAPAVAGGGTTPPPTGSPGAGHIATSNVTQVATIPVDSDTAGGRMVGRDFFVRTAKGITIYDTTNPELPVPKGFVAVAATPNQEREDIDTNGKVLVTGQSIGGTLTVVDVTDRTRPRVIAELAGAADHTNTCVLDCTYVYGSEGTIVDLRVPTAPKLLPNKWTAAGGSLTPAGHDLTEVQPGLLLAASNPVAYLDARNPALPKRLSNGKLADNRYMHGMGWPRGGADRFVLGGSETGLGCQGELGSFVVWDTQDFKDGQVESPSIRRDFVRKGEYRLERGLPTDLKGQAPAAQHCGHWFDVHPSFDDGGLVAMAWYTSGVRFLNVTPEGTVEEQGFWQPLPGQSSAAYWVTEDLLYVTDYTARGFDVLRFDRKAPAQTDAAAPGSFLVAGSAEEAKAQAATRALEARIGNAVDHHGSLAEMAALWVCRPDGTMAPVGVPSALGGTA